MAKRRNKAKTSVRRVYVKASKKRRTSPKESLSKLIMGSAIYGALREKASTALLPLTNKIPLGNISDEAVMLGISYLAWKKGKGMVKNIGKAGVTIESARIGEAIASGSVGGFLNSSSTSSTYVYG